MSISGALKTVSKIANQIDNVELHRALIELQNDVLALTEERATREGKIAELEKALELKGKMKHYRSVYWLVDGENIEGVFCSKCFDIDHIMCRMVITKTEGQRWISCQNCKIEIDSYLAYTYIQRNKIPEDILNLKS